MRSICFSSARASPRGFRSSAGDGRGRTQAHESSRPCEKSPCWNEGSQKNMPRRNFEKPQKGTRRELTVNQHVWPLKSIARFADGTGQPYFIGRLDEARSADKAGLALNPTFTLSRARALWTARSDDP